MIHPARIDPLEIAGPVAVHWSLRFPVVHRHRLHLLEKRRGPDGAHPEAAQVVKLVDYPLQVAPPVLPPVAALRIEHLVLLARLVRLSLVKPVEHDEVERLSPELGVRSQKRLEVEIHGGGGWGFQSDFPRLSHRARVKIRTAMKEPRPPHPGSPPHAGPPARECWQAPRPSALFSAGPPDTAAAR
jgi:hypothetical protein